VVESGVEVRERERLLVIKRSILIGGVDFAIVNFHLARTEVNIIFDEENGKG
jgi:hypothetical protein